MVDKVKRMLTSANAQRFGLMSGARRVRHCGRASFGEEGGGKGQEDLSQITFKLSFPLWVVRELHPTVAPRHIFRTTSDAVL